jgi:predicted Zn-dependent protease
MKNRFSPMKNLQTLLLAAVMVAVPASVLAQTKVVMPKNKQPISKDMEIGQKASAEVERTFPMINDRTSEAYIQEVGDRLARGIPAEFRRSEFNCRFKIVNASDINAFALPACYLYVNRGLIEVAKNEGEMAGVMAHEISHAMLRHGTASGPGIWSQIGALGMILGGAVVGGQAGAQAGQIVAAAWMTKYSRAYEKNADYLGAQIMANAGYDPRDLANMFKTIAGENPNRPPQWLSSHPDPGNRYNYINEEAGRLNVSRNPIKITQGFQRIQNYLRSLPKAKTMEQLEKEAQGKAQGQNPTAGGKYSNNVPLPSTSLRTYNAGNVLQATIPSNWRDFPSENSVMLAPEGAYGDQGITHGAMIGVQRGQGGALQQETDAYVNGVLQGNSYLSKQSGYTRGSISGKNALAIQLAGTSPVTGRTELVTVYTCQMSTGDLLYVIFVVPQQEVGNYQSTFTRVRNSIRINDR